MNIGALLDQLRAERERLSDVIASLERLAVSRRGGRRRGRPPAWMIAAGRAIGKTRGRPPAVKEKPRKEW